MKEVENFYKWLSLRVKSVHLADNEQMSLAFEIVYKNSLKYVKQ